MKSIFDKVIGWLFKQKKNDRPYASKALDETETKLCIYCGARNPKFEEICPDGPCDYFCSPDHYAAFVNESNESGVYWRSLGLFEIATGKPAGNNIVQPEIRADEIRKVNEMVNGEEKKKDTRKRYPLKCMSCGAKSRTTDKETGSMSKRLNNWTCRECSARNARKKRVRGSE